MTRIATIGLLVFWATGCGDAAPPGDPVATEDAGAHTFGPFSLGPGEEDSGICVSWTLNNEEPLAINAVELTADAGFHHSNWFYVPDERFPGDDGIWPCDERSFSEPVAAALGGVLFAQSTQSTHEIQQFPDGVVQTIPAHTRILANVHLLNTSSEAIEPQLELKLHTIASGEVTTQLAGMMLQYEALALPPMSKSAFASSCSMDEMHQEKLGVPLDFSIYYVLPHYHDLGRGMRLEAVGEAGSEVIFENAGSVGDPLGRMLDTPFDLAGYQGLRFSCHYDNPRMETVGWGIGDQEMCVLLAFTDSPNLWGGGVFGKEPAVTEPSNVVDGVPEYEDACTMLTYPAKR